MVKFGQVILGPPGSGKTTYCEAMTKLLSKLGRKVVVINLGEFSGHSLVNKLNSNFFLSFGI